MVVVLVLGCSVSISQKAGDPECCTSSHHCLPQFGAVVPGCLTGAQAEWCLHLEEQEVGRFVSNCGGWQSAPKKNKGRQVGEAASNWRQGNPMSLLLPRLAALPAWPVQGRDLVARCGSRRGLRELLEKLSWHLSAWQAKIEGPRRRVWRGRDAG